MIVFVCMYGCLRSCSIDIRDYVNGIEVVHMMSNDVIKMQKLINYTYIYSLVIFLSI